MLDTQELGLTIEKVSPLKNSINNNVNSEIKITFNSDLIPKSIKDKIAIIKDSNFEYPNSKTEIELVEGNLSYKDRTIIFKSKEPLEPNTRYVISIKKDVQSVRGKNMEFDFEYSFFTEAIGTLPGVEIISPKIGEVINENIEAITWIPQDSDIYLIQVSKEKTFEVLNYENVYKRQTPYKNTCSIDMSDLDFTDGLYYLRIKSANGEWSQTSQFFIKNKIDGVASVEDAFDKDVLEDEEEYEPEILEYFPKQNDLMVNPNINIVYVRVKGEIKQEDIDFNNSFIVGELLSQDDQYTAEDHGCISYDSVCNIIYDSEKDESFIIFSLPELEEGESNGI